MTEQHHPNDYFSLEEMYLLLAATDGNVLFGFPGKEMFLLRDDDPMAFAHQQLIAKEILTPEGAVTKSGAFVINKLSAYHQSKKYVRCNNIMFSFQEENKEEVVLIIEAEKNKYYRLLVLSKAHALKVLYDGFPIVSREPAEDEKTFLTAELSNQEKNEIKAMELSEPLFNLEVFHLDNYPADITEPSFYQNWLLFLYGDKLITLDIARQQYQQVSQYWFIKQLFDEMEFPYKEVAQHG
ncbi:DUF5081 family protein [Listeria booriae]|uniref:DUF5081 family protein n=1 Tax=Listeria booriae TaxID=1552123 RepID=A0A7X0YP65_9LIST|nr:DUF5081 family protein [Listeria booriae]MBC2118062.1 DUF5081 family protein [Listeria booriae]